LFLFFLFSFSEIKYLEFTLITNYEFKTQCRRNQNNYLLFEHS